MPESGSRDTLGPATLDSREAMKLHGRGSPPEVFGAAAWGHFPRLPHPPQTSRPHSQGTKALEGLGLALWSCSATYSQPGREEGGSQEGVSQYSRECSHQVD